ncbi:MAG: hypothetical protein M3485_05535 [Pseudomonadota bacterium]|nr:hypothetical protein [Pseudomonadota bacterium]
MLVSSPFAQASGMDKYQKLVVLVSEKSGDKQCKLLNHILFSTNFRRDIPRLHTMDPVDNLLRGDRRTTCPQLVP